MVRPPEKRGATLYVRVKPTNKDWLEKFAKSSGLSVSALLDYLIEQAKLSK